MLNKDIYEYAQALTTFEDCNIRMPVRINFYLQKNIKLIKEAANAIELARLGIGAQFGEPNVERTGFNIPPEKIEAATQELQELLGLEQDITIHKFHLSDFDGIELTYQQMAAIMFMIEED